MSTIPPFFSSTHVPTFKAVFLSILYPNVTLYTHASVRSRYLCSPASPLSLSLHWIDVTAINFGYFCWFQKTESMTRLRTAVLTKFIVWFFEENDGTLTDNHDYLMPSSWQIVHECTLRYCIVWGGGGEGRWSWTDRGGRGRIITWMAISPHVRIRGSLSRVWSVNAHPHRAYCCSCSSMAGRQFCVHTYTHSAPSYLTCTQREIFVSTCPTMTAGHTRWNVNLMALSLCARVACQ